MKKILVAVLLLFAVILSAGCVTEETVEVGDEVAVFYTLSLDDGTIQESNVGQSPLSFVVGGGQMISGFDAAVVGMKVGETKEVRLAPSEAYGEITDDMIQEMTITELLERLGDIPSEGDVLPVTVQTNAGYQRMYMKILDVDEKEGIVSFALTGARFAGEYLTFEITLDSILN